jgi:hypothetical protein
MYADYLEGMSLAEVGASTASALSESASYLPLNICRAGDPAGESGWPSDTGEAPMSPDEPDVRLAYHDVHELLEAVVKTLTDVDYEVGEAVLIVRGRDPDGDDFQIIHASMPREREDAHELVRLILWGAEAAATDAGLIPKATE